MFSRCKYCFLPILILIAVFSFNLNAKVWRVGGTRTYTVPGAVQSLVNDGDTIYIDGGVYANDAVVWNNSNLKFIGLGTSANPTVIKYVGDIPNEKGIWVFPLPAACDNEYIENITFSGAQVSDNYGSNGAGVRFQAVNLTINRCKFEYCQDGILEGGSYSGSTVIIKNSEFAHNGYNGPGNSRYGYVHQMYISAQTDSLVVENCYIHDVRGQGQSIKSRAQKSYILYNMIDENLGDGSYELDIAQGGLVVAMGNVIIQGINDVNHSIICLEVVTNPLEEIYIVNNTIINKYPGNCWFISILPSTGLNVLKVYNNIFASVPSANSVVFSSNMPSVIDSTKNYFINDYTKLGFINPSAYNYNLLYSATTAIDNGTSAGKTSNAFPLIPRFMYQADSLPLLPRSIIGSAIDLGAYEYQSKVDINSPGPSLTPYILFPNPFINEAYIKFDKSLNIAGSIIIKIYDNSGRLVKSELYDMNDDKIIIRKDDLKTGLYFYEIISNDIELISRGRMLVGI